FKDGAKFDVELLDFNLACPPATLRIHTENGPFDVTLHEIEAWTHHYRYNPGRDSSPKVFFGTIDAGQDGLHSHDALIQGVYDKYLKKYNLETFSLVVAATTD